MSIPSHKPGIFGDVPECVIPVSAKRRTVAFNARRRMQHMNKVFMKAITSDDIRNIAKMAVEKARDGDLDAIKFVTERVMGKTPQQIDFNDITDRRTAKELAQEVMRQIAPHAEEPGSKGG